MDCSILRLLGTNRMKYLFSKSNWKAAEFSLYDISILGNRHVQPGIVMQREFDIKHSQLFSPSTSAGGDYIKELTFVLESCTKLEGEAISCNPLGSP